MTSLSRVQDAELRARLSAVPRKAKHHSDLKSDELAAFNLIVHPNELGMGFMPFEEAYALDSLIIGSMRDCEETEYVIINPRNINFVTVQDSLRLDGVLRYIKDPYSVFGLGSVNEPRFFQMEDGLMVLIDGNHRIAAALLTGRSIEVAIRRRSVAIAA